MSGLILLLKLLLNSGLIILRRIIFHSQRAGDYFFKKENKIFTPIGREILFFWQIKYIFSLPKT